MPATSITVSLLGNSSALFGQPAPAAALYLRDPLPLPQSDQPYHVTLINAYGLTLTTADERHVMVPWCNVTAIVEEI